MNDYELEILSNRKVADGVMEMSLRIPVRVALKGGQFIHIALHDGAHILRRPLCICDCEEDVLTVCYAIVGEGTSQMSRMQPGEKVRAMFPLGNGWSAQGYKNVVLLGGGLGAAVLPLVARTDESGCKFTAYMGFADKSKVILKERMSGLCPTVICTDNGSEGRKGYVGQVLAEDIASGRIAPDAIFCCGPEVVYRSMLKDPRFDSVPIFASLESRMGCGLGACLVCTCGIKTSDGVKNLRVCADGPVFPLREVQL